jgi:hypothetical protein
MVLKRSKIVTSQLEDYLRKATWYLDFGSVWGLVMAVSGDDDDNPKNKLSDVAGLVVSLRVVTLLMVTH